MTTNSIDASHRAMWLLLRRQVDYLLVAYAANTMMPAEALANLHLAIDTAFPVLRKPQRDEVIAALRDFIDRKSPEPIEHWLRLVMKAEDYPQMA